MCPSYVAKLKATEEKPHEHLSVARCTSVTTTRVEALDWAELTAQLAARGFAVTPPILSEGERSELADLFEEGRFRSTIDMARHRFGDGRYRYFEHPLPPLIG